MSIRLEVWGDYACYTRPELKTERYTYDVITPGAAAGILEAIFWHPGLHYQIDRVYVLSPIQFTSIRRNEVKSKIGGSGIKSAIKKGEFGALYLNTKAEIVQRAATVLKNVQKVNVIISHISAPGNFRLTSDYGKEEKLLRRTKARRKIWESCCIIWNIHQED